MRLWDQTCYLPVPCGKLKELQLYMSTFAGVCSGAGHVSSIASLSAAQRLPVSDQVLLRASIVSYWQAAREVPNSNSPMSFRWLHEMLNGLNVELKQQLFGGSEVLAKAAAQEVASGRKPSAVIGRTTHRAQSHNVKSVPAALKVLRKNLELGRRKALRRDVDVATPQKRRRLSIDQAPVQEIVMLGQHSHSTPEKTSPDKSGRLGDEMAPCADTDATLIRIGLEEAVRDIVAQFKKKLPKCGDVNEERVKQSVEQNVTHSAK